MTSSDGWRRKSNGGTQTYGTPLTKKRYGDTGWNYVLDPSVVAKTTSITDAQGRKRRLIQEVVDSLLVKGAIEPVRDQSRGFYSNLFLVKKSDGGLRPVINLRGLNFYIKMRTFRMSTIEDVSQSIQGKTGPPQ